MMSRPLAAAFALIAAIASGATLAAPAAAKPQGAPEAVPRPTAEPSVEMHTVFEKTIFRADVLSLDVWLGPETAAAVARWLPATTKAAVDSVARVALRSRDAWARMTMLRNVGLDRFIGGITENLAKARDAGIVTPATYATVARSLPEWYSPLRERGFRSGDRLFYRIQGDSLRTVVQQEDGRVVVDQVDVGPQRRLAVLGGFLVRGSDFRGGLLSSLPPSMDEPGTATRLRRH